MKRPLPIIALRELFLGAGVGGPDTGELRRCVDLCAALQRLIDE